MAEHYDVGDLAVAQATFQSAAGAPTDPTTVTLRVRKPDGTVSTYTAGSPEVVHVDTGVYAATWTLDESGFWRWKWDGDAPAQGSESGILIADPTPFETGWPETTRRQLCTIEQVKEYLSEPLEDTTYDLMIDRLIDAAAVAFYRYTRREFTPIAVPAAGGDPLERTYDLGDWERANRRVLIGDLASLDGLVVSTAYQNGDPIQVVDPLSVIGMPRDRDTWEPITELWFPPYVTWPASLSRNTVMTVAGDWGFPAVPDDVRQLAIVQVSIWFSRDVAKFSGTFSLAEGRTIRPRALDDAVRDGLDVGYRFVGVS